MESIGSAMDKLYITQEQNYRGTMSQTPRKVTTVNYLAERSRRRKLSDKLLTLRSQVPIITNLIIDDAITYIQELQSTVKVLSNQLFEKDVSIEEENNKKQSDEEVFAEEKKQSDIKEDVVVRGIDGDKFQVKIIIEKRRGRFTRLLEDMAFYGFNLSETNVSTSNGAFLVTSWVEGIYGDKLPIHRTRELSGGLRSKSSRKYCWFSISYQL
ncbi:transcription factor DYT1 [Tripterygium wilfordii]|uniref:Transcription factor DYT1 n=1 Tax=Tripterygium wilfordii TaxID=458696 RepID=A0A7J7D7A3_TRIWF|nr:transcription factor DYT1-like [Tripterygium wilfordii]KAF5742212.1 transcription factor DYT1 [Tripterygium wilfordii]